MKKQALVLTILIGIISILLTTSALALPKSTINSTACYTTQSPICVSCSGGKVATGILYQTICTDTTGHTTITYKVERISPCGDVCMLSTPNPLLPKNKDFQTTIYINNSYTKTIHITP